MDKLQKVQILKCLREKRPRGLVRNDNYVCIPSCGTSNDLGSGAWYQGHMYAEAKSDCHLRSKQYVPLIVAGPCSRLPSDRYHIAAVAHFLSPSSQSISRVKM